jgi:hypothetical protein
MTLFSGYPGGELVFLLLREFKEYVYGDDREPDL